MDDMDWWARARCRGQRQEIFYDAHGPNDEAKAICRMCPVRIECLNHALRTREPFGTWGGVSAAVRTAMLRSKPRRSCPDCGATAIFLNETYQACPACGHSWRHVLRSAEPRKDLSILSASSQTDQSLSA